MIVSFLEAPGLSETINQSGSRINKWAASKNSLSIIAKIMIVNTYDDYKNAANMSTLGPIP
jgi:hypothetical protein